MATLRLEYIYISRGRLYSQPTILYGFRHARNKKVKFWKYVLIASYIGCKWTAVKLLCDILYSRNTSECCAGLSLVPRAVATVGRVVITIFFGNAMTTPTISMSCRTLILNLTSKISNSRKMTPWPFENFKITMGDGEKQKLIILTKTGYTGWPNKNAPSLLAYHFLLVIDRNLIFCSQIEHSILSWP